MSTFGQLKVVAPLLLSKMMKKGSSGRLRVNAFLVKQMGESKGLWLKVGQMLSLNPGSWEGLEGLPESENIPPIPKEDFLPYLQGLFSEVGLELSKEFPIINFPGFPASLSQVHSARDSEDNEWMIKAKLPGIHDLIFDQLSLLGFVKRVEGFQVEKKSFATKDYQLTIRESFDRELDYEQERLNLTEFKKLEARYKQAKVPKLHSKIQSKDFIVMERAQGMAWNEALKTFTFEDKRTLGHQLLEQFLYQYFCLGKAQGDFHPGNFLITNSQEEVGISWIDLGQCLTPTHLQRQALFIGLQALLKGEPLELGPLFSAWNFNLEKLAPIASKLPLLLSKLFQPFTSQAAFSLKSWNLKKDIDVILGEDKWWFRTAGSADLFLSIRCWIGLFSMLESLDCPLFFKGIWLELEQEIKTNLPDTPLPSSTLQKVSFDDLAKTLRVQILQGHQERINVTLPARAIEDIKNFLSSSTLEEMEKAQIKIEEVVKKQLEKGLIPGPVVDFNDGEKRYLVTLEK